jgi:hypothetical protein
MQLSSSTKTAFQSSYVHWMETLSVSVTSFFAGVWFTPQPAFVTIKHSHVFYRHRVTPWSAPACGMLVASDVSSKSAGLVP